MEILGSIITLIGALFLLLGSLGILRMPDVYNRMQAGTKATTMGTILFLIGIAIGNWDMGLFGKILILITFVIFTNPVSSNVIARAAHFAGIKLTDKTLKDDLHADTSEQGDKA